MAHAEEITLALSKSSGLTVRKVSDRIFLLHLGGKIEISSNVPLKIRDDLSRACTPGDAWSVCIDTQDVDEIVRTVQLIAPVYGGINLEDISAPRCFEIERRLRELLDIPVFHDDQHGTAIVISAALRNALRLLNKELKGVKIVMSGVGAAGTAIARLLVLRGASQIIGFDKAGVISKSLLRSDDEMRNWFIDKLLVAAAEANADCVSPE